MDNTEEWLSITMEKTMTDKKQQNFKSNYSEFDTIEEARVNAQRETARSFRSQDIWQRIEETVVPAIDIQLKPTDVTTVPVA